jgi:hypothetical protein
LVSSSGLLLTGAVASKGGERVILAEEIFEDDLVIFRIIVSVIRSRPKQGMPRRGAAERWAGVVTEEEIENERDGKQSEEGNR